MTDHITLRRAAEQALEALEFFKGTAICDADTKVADEGITALRAALAASVQEPFDHTAYRAGLRDAAEQIDAEMDCVETEHADDPVRLKAALGSLINAKQLIMDTLAMAKPVQEPDHTAEIERAVATEREACAKVCEDRYMGDNNREDMEAKRCAEAIRARGEK